MCSNLFFFLAISLFLSVSLLFACYSQHLVNYHLEHGDFDRYMIVCGCRVRVQPASQMLMVYNEMSDTKRRIRVLVRHLAITIDPSIIRRTLLLSAYFVHQSDRYCLVLSCFGNSIRFALCIKKNNKHQCTTGQNRLTNNNNKIDFIWVFFLFLLRSSPLTMSGWLLFFIDLIAHCCAIV